MIKPPQMKLTTKSKYGTRILVELANQYKKGPMQVSVISRLQNIPVKYLEQIIRPLKKAHFVSSVRGAKGGHMLAKNPEKITLGMVIRLFEPQTDLVECVSCPEKCLVSDNCKMRIAWQEATEVLFEKLDSIRIADLINKQTD